MGGVGAPVLAGQQPDELEAAAGQLPAAAAIFQPPRAGRRRGAPTSISQVLCLVSRIARDAPVRSHPCEVWCLKAILFGKRSASCFLHLGCQRMRGGSGKTSRGSVSDAKGCGARFADALQAHVTALKQPSAEAERCAAQPSESGRRRAGSAAKFWSTGWQVFFAPYSRTYPSAFQPTTNLVKRIGLAYDEPWML